MLILAGALFLAINMDLVSLEGTFTLPMIAGGVAALALPFLIAWLINREQSWTLVPAWVFVSLAVILMIIWLELPQPQIAPVVVLVQIAIPFLVTYLANRQNWWALIPTYVMLVLAALVALTALRTPEEMMGGIALIFVALPFWWIYMRDRSRWWALIPAGGLSAIALPLMFLSSQRLIGQGEFILFTALLAVLFVIVWVTNRRLDWALWTAGGFVISIGLAIIRPEFRQSWPVVLLALGGYIVSRQLFGRREKKAAQAQQAQPGAPQGKAPSATVLPPSERPPEPVPPRHADDVTFRPLDIPSDEPPAKE
jgi:hypothetical protein